MNEILKEYINKFVLVYIDDVVIYSRNVTEHIEHLKLVFQKIEAANLKLGGDKCEIGKRFINILGHTIKENEILPQEEKVSAIKKIKVPKT